mgnify:CR=1 FL=1
MQQLPDARRWLKILECLGLSKIPLFRWIKSMLLFARVTVKSGYKKYNNPRMTGRFTGICRREGSTVTMYNAANMNEGSQNFNVITFDARGDILVHKFSFLGKH